MNRPKLKPSAIANVNPVSGRKSAIDPKRSRMNSSPDPKRQSSRSVLLLHGLSNPMGRLIMFSDINSFWKKRLK